MRTNKKKKKAIFQGWADQLAHLTKLVYILFKTGAHDKVLIWGIFVINSIDHRAHPIHSTHTPFTSPCPIYPGAYTQEAFG